MYIIYGYASCIVTCPANTGLDWVFPLGAVNGGGGGETSPRTEDQHLTIETHAEQGVSDEQVLALESAGRLDAAEVRVAAAEHPSHAVASSDRELHQLPLLAVSEPQTVFLLRPVHRSPLLVQYVVRIHLSAKLVTFLNIYIIMQLIYIYLCIHILYIPRVADQRTLLTIQRPILARTKYLARKIVKHADHHILRKIVAYIL